MPSCNKKGCTPLRKTPVGHASFPREIIAAPRSWCEAAFNVVHWTDMPRGGHFAALEQPKLLLEDVRAFFRRFRGQDRRTAGPIRGSPR
jgi:hypothetical protein